MGYSVHFRLQFIDRAIRQQTYPSILELADGLECSERTVHRDIAYLRDLLGAPVEHDRKRNGYYYQDETWILPAIVFSQQELLALHVARNAAINYTGMPYKLHLASAFDKIFEFIPQDKASYLDVLDEEVSFRFGGSRAINPDVMNAVSTGLREKRCIEMYYYAASRDEKTRRIVDPYHIDNFHGDWYLIGYCHLRCSIRTFAINRIESCIVLNNTFERLPDFDYQSFIKDSLGVLRSEHPIKIVIHFSGFEARLNREREWHPSQKIEYLQDGSIIMTICVSGVEEVKRWLLSCGAGATVVEPEWLANDILAEIEAVKENYGKNNFLT